MRRAVFAFWSWVLLVVAGLSSIPPQGQIAPRQHGSAFDPTTSSVAVRPKRIEAAAVNENHIGGLPRERISGGGTVIEAGFAPVVVHFSELRRAAARFARVDIAPRPRLLGYPLGARAPPSL